MVRIHPDPPGCEMARSRANRDADVYKAYTRRRATKSGEARGAVAQLGERLLCKQEVIGSIPFTSTMNPTGSWCPTAVTKLPREGRGGIRDGLLNDRGSTVCLQCACIAGAFFDRVKRV